MAIQSVPEISHPAPVAVPQAAPGKVERKAMAQAVAPVSEPPPPPPPPPPPAPAPPPPAPVERAAVGQIVWTGQNRPNMATVQARWPANRLEERKRGGGLGYVVVVVG